LGLALIGETFYKNVFKISGTIGPEKLKFTWKLNDIVRKHIW
jgi:hypothetical protein